MVGIKDWEQNHIHESILFGIAGISNDAIAINYSILHANHYIYLEKLKDDNKKVDSM